MILLTNKQISFIMTLKSVPDYFLKTAMLLVPKLCPLVIKIANKLKNIIINTGIYKILTGKTLSVKNTTLQRVTKTTFIESHPLRFIPDTNEIIYN